jgi:hypothetical protein
MTAKHLMNIAYFHEIAPNKKEPQNIAAHFQIIATLVERQF